MDKGTAKCILGPGKLHCALWGSLDLMSLGMDKRTAKCILGTWKNACCFVGPLDLMFLGDGSMLHAASPPVKV